MVDEREGRFGVNRPLGSVLEKYRPLIKAKFDSAPKNIASVATALSESRAATQVSLSDLGDGRWTTDFVLDVKGADEFSTSGVAFTEDGEFLGGAIRAANIKVTTEEGKEIISEKWKELATKEGGLALVDEEIMMRENGTVVTPHLIFASRNPTVDNQSSLTTPEFLEVIEDIHDNWSRYFGDTTAAGRVSFGERNQGEQTTSDDSITDMMDFDIL